MKTIPDIIDKIEFYEKCGFKRSEAIGMIQIEQMVVIEDRINKLLNKVGNSGISDTQKGGD